MTENLAEWQETYIKQRSQFLENTLRRLPDMVTLLDNLRGSAGDINLVRQLGEHFHQLAGAGGLYEMTDLSRLAIRGEEILRLFLQSPANITAGSIQEVRQLMDSLESAIANQSAGPVPSMEQSKAAADDARPEGIMVVTGTMQTVNSLTGALEKLCLEVIPYCTAGSAREALNKRMPGALIVDVPLPDGPGYDLARCVRAHPEGASTPVLMLSQEIGFLNKVLAIRSGADAIFEHPLDFKAISSKLEDLFEKTRPSQYRILYMEDDPDQANLVESLLKAAGYNAICLQDPKLFEETLIQYGPDLLLLDISLGVIDGIELARFVRQNERFATVPIIFLTTQNQLNMHIASASAGGDDHLIKPVAPQLLIATIAGRLERYRTLRKLIGQDGLTGCLTYGAFMDELSRLTHAQTHAYDTQLMLIDVDNLRAVNEKFGYAAGDKVIASLANILRGTFRHSALTGRAGGNCIGVASENLDESELAGIAGEVLSQFKSSQHKARGSSFTVTASAAIAAVPSDRIVATWLAVADKRLKQAKQAGPGQIVTSAGLVASPPQFA